MYVRVMSVCGGKEWLLSLTDNRLFVAQQSLLLLLLHENVMHARAPLVSLRNRTNK